jgi:hypothetical protein
LAAGLGTILAGEQVLAWGKDAVESAAQIQKSTENVKAQFKGASDSVIKFGEDAAKQFGISEQASLGFSSQMGLVAKNIGLGHDQAAQMDIGLQKLAGSIGLIKGEDPSSVFDKLSQALLGNTRGLKSMGIAITPLNEKLEAQRRGFIGPKGTISSLTAAQKATVIYGIATRHLGEFQAEAKKHSGDFADQLIVLRARLSNVADNIGQKVLPVVSSLVGEISKIADAPNITVGIGIAVHGIENTAKTIAAGIQHAFEGSSKTVKIKAPSGLIVGEREDFSKGIVQNLEAGLEHADWGKIGHQIGKGIGSAITFTSDTMNRLVSGLADAVDTNKGKIASVGLLIIADMFQDLLSPGFWLSHWAIALGVGLSALGLAAAPESFAARLAKALPLGDIIVGSLRGLGKPIITAGKFIIRTLADAIGEEFPSVARAGEGIASRLIMPLRSLPGRAADNARGMIVSFVREVVHDLGEVAGAARDLVSAIVRPLEGLAGRVAGPVLRAGRTIIHAIGGIAWRAFSQGIKVGRSIMEGIAGGLDGLVGWLEGKISGIASGLLNKAKGILHIGSPSKRFAEEVGKPIAQGIALGITRHSGRIDDALAQALAMPRGGHGMHSMGGGSLTIEVPIYLDGVKIGQALRKVDKAYRRQNGGRPLLSGA